MGAHDGGVAGSGDGVGAIEAVGCLVVGLGVQKAAEHCKWQECALKTLVCA